MQSASNLKLTAQSRALASHVYRITAGFPDRERYALSAQMRRAAVSVGSNIAEGCGRSGDRELLQFLHVALGSLSELEFQSLLARDLGMLSDVDTPALLEELDHARRMLLRLIVAVRTRVTRAASRS